MAEIVPSASLDVTVTISLTECEACALEALTGYGTDAFLNFFYEHLGRHYLQPHEHGLRTLFQTVKTTIPPVLRRAQRARKAWMEEPK